MFRLILIVIILFVSMPSLASGFKDSSTMGISCSICHTTNHRENDIVKPIVINTTYLSRSFADEVKLFVVQFKDKIYLVNSKGGIIQY